MRKVKIKNTQTISDVSIKYSARDVSNPTHMLTIEELKSFPGCENIDDKEAEKIIQSLYELGQLTYEITFKEKI